MIMNYINIINKLNFTAFQNNTLSSQNSSINAFIDEALKLLLENKDLNNNQLTAQPFQTLPFLSLIQNNQNSSVSLQLENHIKNELLSLFKKNNLNTEDLSGFLQKTKTIPKTEDFDSFVIKTLPTIKNSTPDNPNATSLKLNDSFSLDKAFLIHLAKNNVEDTVKLLHTLQNTTVKKSFDEAFLQSNIVHNFSTNIPEPKKVELFTVRFQEISDILLKAISNSQKTITVQLEPPELGRILIKLTMDSSGIKADMKVDNPHVKEMIAGLIPEIKSSLQSSGVKLSDFILDLMRDTQEDSAYNQHGQKKYKGNQKFFEYFA